MRTGYNTAQLPTNLAQQRIRDQLAIVQKGRARLQPQPDMTAVLKFYQDVVLPAAFQDWKVFLLRLGDAMRHAKKCFETTLGVQGALDKAKDDFWKAVLKTCTVGAVQVLVAAIPVPGAGAAVVGFAGLALSTLNAAVKLGMASYASKNFTMPQYHGAMPSGNLFEALMRAAADPGNTITALVEEENNAKVNVGRLYASYSQLPYDPNNYRRVLKCLAFCPFLQAPASDYWAQADLVAWAADIELSLWANWFLNGIGSKVALKKRLGNFLADVATGALDKTATAVSTPGMAVTPPGALPTTLVNLSNLAVNTGASFNPKGVVGGVTDAVYDAGANFIRAGRKGTPQDPGTAVRLRLRKLGYGTGSKDDTFVGTKFLYQVMNMPSYMSQEAVGTLPGTENNYLSSSVLLHRTWDNDYVGLQNWAQRFTYFYSGGIGPLAFVLPTDQVYLDELISRGGAFDDDDTGLRIISLFAD